MPDVSKRLGILNDGLASTNYFAGDTPMLADWLIEPVVTYVTFTPEDGDLMKETPNLSAWHGRISSRPSFKATLPEG